MNSWKQLKLPHMEEKIDAHKWNLKILPNNFFGLKIAGFSNIIFLRIELYFSKNNNLNQHKSAEPAILVW
jgi:hypothetical protein